MGINGAGRGAQAGQSGGFDAAIRGEPGTPDVPKARFAESELAIGFDAFVPLAPDDFLPEFEGVFGFEEVGLPDDFGKDVEIVNLAEHVLEALEIVAPGGVVLGQEVLDGVAEALQCNTHRVPGFGFFRAQGFCVKIPGGFESFERQAFGGETPSRHEARALAQSAVEALPGFLVEFVCHAERVLSQTGFVRFERSLQMRADGVGFGSELLYPLVHYLSIAKRACCNSVWRPSNDSSSTIPIPPSPIAPATSKRPKRRVFASSVISSRRIFPKPSNATSPAPAKRASPSPPFSPL